MTEGGHAASDRAATRSGVAVIGLGNIGGGVARTLARHHVQPTVFDLDLSAIDRAIASGAVAAASAADAARTAEVVFTSLPGPQQIAQVADEILASMRSGAIWVELSTNDLATAQMLRERCTEHGVRMIDAPVSGGPEGAEAGTLSVFVGGDSDDVAEVRPLLEIIGEKVDHLGPAGAGITAKIAQVILCYTQTVTLIEALILGVKGGVAPEKMLDLIRHSAGTSYCADVYGPEILAGTYDASFPVSHAAKDLRLATELAGALGAELPFTAAVAELYADTEAEYGPTAAHCLAAQRIERLNDVLLHQLVNSPGTVAAQQPQ